MSCNYTKDAPIILLLWHLVAMLMLGHSYLRYVDTTGKCSSVITDLELKQSTCRFKDSKHFPPAPSMERIKREILGEWHFNSCSCGNHTLMIDLRLLFCRKATSCLKKKRNQEGKSPFSYCFSMATLW